ncbi:MAG: hypothetical protein WA192_13765 [Candidatus Acidiferrales bacterium]
MKYIAFLLGLFVLAPIHAAAQTNAANSVLLPSSYFAVPASADSSPAVPAITLTPFSTAPANAAPGVFAPSAPLSLLPAAAPPQDVTSVFESYNWQAYLGYTFLRFYELPNITENTNGFNYSMVYYFKDWFGLDGEFAATHGTQDSVSSWFLFGGGGPRFRWSARKGIEIWAHALVGYSHFTPQTPAGNQHALAYEFGGGVDLPFKPRWAIRVEADAMGTQYFNTYQYSPKASAGVVFKF